VVWGSVIGSLAAMLWFLVTQYVFTPLYPTVASWKLAEFFLIR
jgi:dolichyldiphosphatase